MQHTYTGRLAPSPTGLLHLGHAATFLAAYDRSQTANGRLQLRIDDLDAERSKEHFITAGKEDLRWLGLTWTEELRQSDRLALYTRAMQQLLAGGHAYPCTCSRKDLQAALAAPHDDADDEPVYTGRCRPVPATSLALQPGTNYRFRVPDGQAVQFTDERCGPQFFFAGCTPGADFGDFLVWRKDGLPSYQLACAVDDAAMGITEVVRGRDLLKSTARQILLQRALSLPTPAYLHTALLRDGKGQRLAKRHNALSLRTLREAGFTAESLREHLRLHEGTPPRI